MDALKIIDSWLCLRRSVLGKRKAALRVEESAWSDPFTLDTIEDADKVQNIARSKIKITSSDL